LLTPDTNHLHRLFSFPSLFFYGPGPPRDLHSFPTRRSSDLTDGHVEVAGAYYPVPLALLGQRIRVRWDAHLVRVFQGDTLVMVRSEEHTSELQSLRHLVCRLLLEKKKNK